MVAEAHQARIAQVSAQLLRHIKHRQLSAGFLTWVAMCEARYEAREKMRAALGMLGLASQKSEKAHAFMQWVAMWRHAAWEVRDAAHAARFEEVEAARERERAADEATRAADEAARAAESAEVLRQLQLREEHLRALENAKLTAEAAWRAKEKQLRATAGQQMASLKAEHAVRERQLQASKEEAEVALRAEHAARERQLQASKKAAEVALRAEHTAATEKWRLREAELEAAVQQVAQISAAKGACADTALSTESKYQLQLGQLETELSALREEQTATVAYWREQERLWDTSRAEMVHGAEEDLAVERAARVAQVGQQIMRRVLNRDITLGFTSWVAFVEAKHWAMDRLRQAANRLRGKADVVEAFRVWATEMEAVKRAVEAATREQNVASLYQKLRDSEEEVRRLQALQREQLAPTQKYSRAQRHKRMEESRRSMAVLQGGETAVAGRDPKAK